MNEITNCKLYLLADFIKRWENIFSEEEYRKMIDIFDDMVSKDEKGIEIINDFPFEFFRRIIIADPELVKRLAKLKERDYHALYLLINNEVTIKRYIKSTKNDDCN